MPVDLLEQGRGFIEEFFSSKEIKDAHVFMGIDPGAQGAIALLCGPHHVAMDIPTFKAARAGKTKTGKAKTQTVFDEDAILELFDLIDKHLVERNCSLGACLEEAQIVIMRKGPGKATGGNGAYGAFRVGYGFGLWPLFLRARGYSLLVVRPSIWKKALGLSGKDKNYCRQIASRKWPRASLKRVADHDRAEALLLASYLKLKDSD